MWSSRLFWKLFIVYVGLNLTLAAGFLVVVTSSQRSEINRHVEERLHDTAILLRSHVRGLLAEVLDPEAAPDRRAASQQELQALVQRLAIETTTRLTVVASDGTPLADSEHDPETMLTHSNRPELIAAGADGKGTARRPSPTLHLDMFYLALKVDVDHGQEAFVRVAMRVDTVNQRIASVRQFLWLFALLFGAVATALTYAFVGKIIHPLAQLTQRAQAIADGLDEEPLSIHSRDEVGLLAEAFNQMQSELAIRFRQLRDNSEQIATVLSTMEEGIIAIDAQENIVFANQASRILLNSTTAMEAGRPLLEVARSRALGELVRKCFQQQGPVQTELESVGQPRRDLAVRATCLPGEPAPGVVVVLRDITELRRLENLRQEFVANVSHELKTPLASIKAYAETLRLGALNDPENNLRFVVRIEEQAERLHQLILDMLHIARVESGEEVFEIRAIAMQNSIEACVDEFREAAGRKQIELIVQPPPIPLSVLVDEEGLRTIVGNLLSNAIKYTPNQGAVTLRWRSDRGLVLLEVEDTGIGIAERDQARVFERFYRVDQARSRELGDTGLGLSIVKHLTQAFGGSVVLTSQLGKGSTFQVRLPTALV